MEIWALTKKRGSLLLTEPGAAWQKRWHLGWIWRTAAIPPWTQRARGFLQGEDTHSHGGKEKQAAGWGQLRVTWLGEKVGMHGKWFMARLHAGRWESHSRMRRWGDGRKVSEEVDSKMREELRTRKAKAETQTKCSLNGHQRQEQNNSWFKSTSILGMMLALEAEQLFAKVVSEGLDSTCLFLCGKETKHFYVVLMVVMTKWRSW